MRFLYRYLISAGLGFLLGAILLPPFYLCSSHEEPSDLPVSPRKRVGGELDTESEGCICGARARELSRLAEMAPQVAPEHHPQSPFIHTAPPMGEAQQKEFLYPSNRTLDLKGRYRPGSSAEPKSLRDEYLFRKTVFVGVLTQQSYLSTRARSLYETWGRDVDHLIFFVGEDCYVPPDLQHLPIVKLAGIPDNVYPPLRKTFAVLQYMYERHLNQFNWFVRADDDVYMRVKKLRELLSAMVPSQKVYLGRAGTGRKDDLDRLALLPHERYCMGGPGIILSSAALRELGPHLLNCLNAVLQYSKTGYNDDDVEVGRCVSRKIGVQCSSSTESRQYFMNDYTGVSLNSVTLWTNPSLQHLITIHPIKLPDNMLSIHHFYKTLDFKAGYEQVSATATQLNSLCKELPSHVALPLSVSTGCDLKLHPHLAYFNASSKLNHQGGPPSAYMMKRPKVPFFLKPVNKFDVKFWTHFNDTLVQDMGGGVAAPEFSPQPSLQAEISHALGMLRAHIQTEYGSKGAKISTLLDGYVRFNPHLGREYILTVKISRGHAFPSVYRTYHMVREIGPQVGVVSMPTIPPSLAVNVIVPLPTVDGSLTEFLRSLAHVGLKHSNNAVHLVLVVSSESSSKLAESALSNFSSNTFPISASIAVDGHTPFRFLRAYDVGVATLQDDQSLAFLTDVRTRFSPGFFRRCRSNPQLGQRVYFPSPFRLYQSNFRNFSDGSNPAITAWTGQWAFYDYKPVCVYKSDYEAIGGFRNSKYSIDFFEKVLASSLDILQAPEPGLFKVWGDKQCKSLASSRRRYNCREMRARLGQVQQVELADYLGELATKETSILNPKKLSTY